MSKALTFVAVLVYELIILGVLISTVPTIAPSLSSYLFVAAMATITAAAATSAATPHRQKGNP